MPASRRSEEEFLQQLTQKIQENISDERFGVSELADLSGMSRSNLLRRVTKASGVSVSRFIRRVRLERATEILKEENCTVSEVAYKVGFGSPSYFIKCFREEYGFSPGSLDEQGAVEVTVSEEGTQAKKGRNRWLLFAVSFLLPVGIVLVVWLLKSQGKDRFMEKSIAVLPFINDSADSSNVYIINGLMESTLNKLQSIGGLRVISRTSVEKYRESKKTIPEIAEELGVQYVVEGSGQKIADQIQLSVQLIDALSDRKMWGQQYHRKVTDIFALQSEVAGSIVDQIEVLITPAEQALIEERPTDNLEAYDLFLKGIEYLSRKPASAEDLRTSISFFQRAVELDERFARAYSALAMAYYFLEENRAKRSFADSINFYADRALFFNGKLPQAMIAKALFYMAQEQYELAEPYFEKALELRPNYDLAYVFLVDLYARYLPNTAKYLEYALRGLQIDPAAYDSLTISVNYLHISNAFIQAGFVGEALFYIDRSLVFWPDNLYSVYVKAYIEYAADRNLPKLREKLKRALDRDQNRLDIMQELAKICYYQNDYENAYHYYQQYLAIKKAVNFNIYPQEDIKISYTCMKLGKQDEAKVFMDNYENFVKDDPSIYRPLNRCMLFAAQGQNKEALLELNLFSEQTNFNYWVLLFTPLDPIMENLKKTKEFNSSFKKLERNFTAFHNEVKKSLNEKGLLQ